MARVKKNDTVLVLSGKDKGKKGSVLEISREKKRLVVKGVGIQVRHVKARRQGDFSGIKKEEGWINLSKVMLVCTSCKSPCRVNAKVVEGHRNVRICNRCKEVI